MSQTCFHSWLRANINEPSLSFLRLLPRFYSCPLLALHGAQLLCCAAQSGRFLRRRTFWCWWGQRLQPAPHTWPPQGQQVRSCDNPVRIAAWRAYVCPPERLKLRACSRAYVCSRVEFFFAVIDGRLVCHLMVNNGIFRFSLRGWKTHCMLYLAFLSHFQACTVYARARAFMIMFEHVHSHSHLSVHVCVHRDECAICPRGGQRPTPAGDLQRASLHKEKRWNREQRGLTPPPDIVISSFSHHIEERRERTIHSTHTLLRSSTVSSFSKQKKEKNQRAERRGEGGTGWKI